MSEMQSETVAAEPVGSGDAEWDAAGAEAAAEVPAEPTPEPVPVVEPTPVAAEPDPDYTFSTLESGQKELRLATGEIYRGKDDAEVMANLAKGKVESNRYIQQLKNPPPPPVTAPVAIHSQVDPAAQAIADFTAQGLGFRDAAEMKAAIAEFRDTSQRSSQQSQEITEQREAIGFIQATPDYVPSESNNARIEGWVKGKGLPYTAENLADAFYALRGRGMLENIPAAATPVSAKPNIMPPPPSGNSPLSPVGKPTLTVDDIEKMSVAEIEELYASGTFG